MTLFELKDWVYILLRDIKPYPLKIMITVTLNAFPDNGHHAVTEEQRQFALSAVTHLQEMVNNPVFLQRLATVRYTDNYLLLQLAPRIRDWVYRQATNDDLVRVITGGIEWHPADQNLPIDNNINLYAALGHNGARVLGGVNPPDRTIVTNSSFFDRWLRNDNWITLAGHWFHEWLHTAGFHHEDGPADFNDAVYTVGNLLIQVEEERLEALPQPEGGELHEKAAKMEKKSHAYYEAYGIPEQYR